MVKYDLEDRTLKFARDVRRLVRKLPKTAANVEDGKQVIRSSGSVGANYIEGNEATSKKDLIYRVKVSRKEVKETRYWLHILDTGTYLEDERTRLIKESNEVLCILSTIILELEGQRKPKK